MGRRSLTKRTVSPTETQSLVRAGTLARRGGVSTGVLRSPNNSERLKREISGDYRHGPTTGRGGFRSTVNATRKVTYDRDIHVRAAEAYEHFAKTGDARRLTKMASEMNHRRLRAFINWCQRIGGVHWDVRQRVFKKKVSTKKLSEPLIIASAYDTRLELPAEEHPVDKTLKLLHDQAVAAIRHAIATGDTRGVRNVLAAISSDGLRRKMECWLQPFGKVEWISGRPLFALKKSRVEIDVQSALGCPFYTLVSPSTPVLPAAPRQPLAACKVCGRESMPGEDVCYHHQSE